MALPDDLPLTGKCQRSDGAPERGGQWEMVTMSCLQSPAREAISCSNSNNPAALLYTPVKPS